MSATLNTDRVTRARYSDKIKKGDVSWHKDGHLIIKVEKTARGFRRLEILDTNRKLYIEPWFIDDRVFQIDPGTLMLTRKRVMQIEKELDLR